MVVRHPETGKEGLAIAIRLAYYKGVDNKLKPYITSPCSLISQI